MNKDTKEKILASFGCKTVNDLLSLSDIELVRCYGLYSYETAYRAMRYYDESNEDERKEFADVIRDCIIKGKTLYVGFTLREGVKNEASKEWFEKLESNKHTYSYFIE